MAAFHLIATLMVLQGVFFSYSMAQDDGSGSGDDDTISPTTTQMMSTPSSSVMNQKEGPTVKLTLTVSINCSGDNLQKLTNSLDDDIEEAYKSANFPIHTVEVMESCEEEKELFDAIVTLSFYSGIPTGKTIKGVFQDALTDGEIRNLTASNTNFTITFIGADFSYSPKAGECQAICCDGAGGELTVERVCSPADKCEGFEPDEKKEDGHCPGEERDTCPDTCEGEGDSGSRNNLPTFAVIILLVLTKTIFC